MVAPVSVNLVEAPSPSMFDGTSPRRKSSHDPVEVGRIAVAASIPARTPGSISIPNASPMLTAISAVIANQISVPATSRAALPRSRSAATRCGSKDMAATGPA